MTNNDLIEKNDIFIAKVKKTSSSTKTISIPIEFCEFCEIDDGDLIKLKLLEKKSKTKKKK